MSPTLSLLSVSSIFIVFLVLNSFHGVNGDLISDVCTKASTSDPQLKNDFCVASLSANPASKDADLLRLGEISIQTCLQNVTSIYSYMDKIVFGDGKGKQDPKPYYPFNSCVRMYAGAIDFIRIADAKFKIKDYSTTDTILNAALNAPTECEHRFKKSGLVSSFAKQNEDFVQLARISLAITRMVK
ncbi:hypothetical protein MKW92_041570 [Papaver armeniacum]|nr:hypothetical protein MKW92_041570 [Papaver armeniacum]